MSACFSQFGKVDEVFMSDPVVVLIGFVTFENEDVVDRVFEIYFHFTVHNHTIKNKMVECKKNEHKAIEDKVGVNNKLKATTIDVKTKKIFVDGVSHERMSSPISHSLARSRRWLVMPMLMN